MEPRRSESTGDTNRWPEDQEQVPVGIGKVIASTASPKELRIQLIDRIRDVASTDQKHKLFLRAVPPDDYLILLSEARVLYMRGGAETNCKLDVSTGEQICVSRVKQPKEDCRQASCPYAAIMRMRLINRLRGAYARERNKRGGRL